MEILRLSAEEDANTFAQTLAETQFTRDTPLEGGHSGETRHLQSDEGPGVAFKPVEGQTKEPQRAGIAPGTGVAREIAASIFARAIGSGILPVTVPLKHQGKNGSAQRFMEGMVDGREAARKPYHIPMDSKSYTPTDLPNHLAEEMQLLDDLMMHADRHPGNYMLKINPSTKAIEDIALVDNSLSLTAEIGVLSKRFAGPREGQPISPLNQARLRHLIDNETTLSAQLKQWLEPDAVTGLFARAKALLTRGLYGNFKLPEVNAHLTDRQIEQEEFLGIIHK